MEEHGFHFQNGTFKIMQVADAQELHAVSPDTVRLLKMALAAEKPDLVVFTGDQIYGIHPRLWSERSVRRVLTALLAPVVEAGVPFAVTFGNHDAESGIPNPAQAEIYAGFPGYTAGDRRAADDPGTFRIPVYGADGRAVLDVFAFDSHGSAAAGGKNGVNEAQLGWFKAQREAERTATLAPPPALVFQHIPVPEYYQVIDRVSKGTRGAVEAFGSRKNTFYALPDALTAAGGFMKETPAVAGHDEFGVLLSDGHVLALAVGHDHNNSFLAPYKGIDLIYTQGAGFHVYGPHLQRGVRVFVFNEKDPAAYTAYTRTWKSLTNARPREFLLGYALSKTPSSVSQAKAWAKRALPFAAAGAAGAGLLAVCAVKKRKD
ncbi:MAG: metallophosphoesterase family protein [Clostridia bacterium]|nr:metallophosphoesterase family protein [Clostridia bacterium]